MTIDRPIARRPLRSPDDPKAAVPDFAPEVVVLPKGHRESKRSLPLPIDIVFERDVAIRVRDGAVLRADVYRPRGQTDLPSLVAWSPYGKKGGSSSLADFPFRMGVPASAVSGLERFEGPDPAYWCAQGYAIVNPDPRGIGRSDGDFSFWGTQEGQDGADVVDWVGGQEWSNGKVGLTGNSWLAILQYFIAAQQPRHLAAIAPWEGLSDLYRDDVLRGGIPATAFNRSVIDGLSGLGQAEDVPAMVALHPLMDDYWDDKIPAFDRIDVPAYVVASWTNPIHTRGTLDAFERIASAEKWLRVHDSMEWPDYYRPASVAELTAFFDHFLRGAPNGWADTPRIRVSVLGPRKQNTVGRVEASWPPTGEAVELFLDGADGSLRQTVPMASASRYDSDHGHAAFTMRFDRDMELLGYSAVDMWVEAPDAEDMDLYVQIRRLDRHGRVSMSEPLPLPRLLYRFLDLVRRVGRFDNVAMFFRGPTGRLRVSHRALDATRSTPLVPVHTHTASSPIPRGEIVRVQIPFWPAGMRFRAGESLQLVVSGVDTNPPFVEDPTPVSSGVNVGLHVIHTGGERPSVLRLGLRPAPQP